MKSQSEILHGVFDAVLEAAGKIERNNQKLYAMQIGVTEAMQDQDGQHAEEVLDAAVHVLIETGNYGDLVNSLNTISERVRAIRVFVKEI